MQPSSKLAPVNARDSMLEGALWVEANFPKGVTMNHVMQPHRPHAHRVWLIPDSPLGKWTAALFTGAALTVIVIPLLAQVAHVLSQPGSDTPFFFAFWGTMLLALVLVVATGLAALIALVRDHALLLLIPVVVGLVGAAALFASAGLPI